jgi:hypothetical protein
MTTIPLKVLYDLKDRLDDAIAIVSDRHRAERACLDWAEANGLLVGGEQRVSVGFRGTLEGLIRDGTLREVTPVLNGPHGEKKIVEIETEIPAGPQDEADGPPAEEAGAPARIQGPEGAEGALHPDDAPVPPVAGGGTSLQKPSAWTDDQDNRAKALRRAGKTHPQIAAALGRPVQGVKFRFSQKLNAEMSAEDAPKPSDSEQPAPQVAAEPDAPPPASGPDGDGEAGSLAPAAAAPAPAFDPAAPLWFRQIDAVLRAIGYKAPFSPGIDLEFVERLCKGEKLAIIAADLGIDAARLKDRWVALIPDPRPTIGEQQRVLEVLRHRAEAASLKAAE